MRICCLILLAWPLLGAQPTINPDGIVRSDGSRPGLFDSGIQFSIWGHNFGPKDGCKGPATEVCGVQVLLDGAPIEVQFVNDVQINARMPDGAGPAISNLMVVSGGVRSEAVQVQRAPEVAVISPEGEARVDGPVWIHVELPHGYLSYPGVRFAPGYFWCESFEVRKDGKLLPLIAPPLGGFGGNIPPCPGYVKQGRNPPVRANRLPLHLQYNFAEPGTYEVRYKHRAMWTPASGDTEMQSAWTPIQVLPAAPRVPIGVHPQEPDELLSNFLPNLLADRDDETLSVLMEYLYHPSQQVRAWTSSALLYWPDAVLQPKLMATLRAKGPTDVLVQAIKGNAAEVADISLPFLFSDNALLFHGAIRAAALAMQQKGDIDPALRSRVEDDVAKSLASNLSHADATMTNELIVIIGSMHTERAHDLLWNLVEHHTGTEQALIVIAWQKDPKDLPRLADYLIALPADDEAGREASGVIYSVRNTFGDAAVPWLKDVMEKTQSAIVRRDCAEELARVK